MPPEHTFSSILFLFFFNDTATTEIYTLSLHDALPPCPPSPSHPTSAWWPIPMATGCSTATGPPPRRTHGSGSPQERLHRCPRRPPADRRGVYYESFSSERWPSRPKAAAC